MEFDFYTRYQELSDGDLAYIVNNPHKHQPQAVEAARQVLEERGISADALQAYTMKPATAAAVPQNSDYGEYDIFESLKQEIPLHPKMDNYHKWLIAYLIFQAISGVYVIYVSIRNLSIMGYYPLDSVFWISYRAAYIPLVLYFMFKRKPWGWILLFFDLMLPIPSYLKSIYALFTDTNTMFGTLFIGQVLGCALTIFLLRFINLPYVLSYYGVSQSRRRQVVWYTIGIILALELVFYLYGQLYP